MGGDNDSRRRSRRPAKLLIGSLLAVLVLVTVHGTASAHTYFVGSDPADSAALAQPPAAVSLDFDERVVPPLTTVRVVDAEGHEHPVVSVTADPARDTRLLVKLPALSRDTYRLSFSTFDLNDLHRTDGSIVFAVGSLPSLTSAGQSFAAVPVVEVGARWLGIAGLAVALGGLLFALAMPPITSIGTGAAATVRRRLRFLAVGGALAAAAAHGALLVIQAFELGDLHGGLGALLTGSEFGTRWLAEAVLLAGLLLFALLVARRGRRGEDRRIAAMSGGAVSLATAATVLAVLSGHTGGESSPTVAGVTIRAAHLLAVEAWSGGLVALVLAVATMRRLPTDEVGMHATRTLLTRFARWAGPLFAAIAVTGLLISGTEVATVTALLSTTYGLVLVVKVVAVALVALVALRHARMLTRPRIDNAALSRRLRRSLPTEAGVAAFIVVLGAALASSPPARGPQFDTAQAAPSAMSTNVADLVVRVAMRPNLPGRNLLAIDVLNTRRPAPGPIRDVRVELQRPGEPAPRLLVAVHSVEQQTWDGGSVDLRGAGQLRMIVVIDRAGLPSTRAELPWVVNAVQPPPHPVVLSTWPIAPFVDLAAAAIVLAIAGRFVRRRRRRGQDSDTAAAPNAWPSEVTLGTPEPSRAGAGQRELVGAGTERP